MYSTIKDRINLKRTYKFNHTAYPVDWYNKFSPIERILWSYIRIMGLDFHFEFPVGKYFVDFACPFKMIAIEADGKNYHTDKEKDKKRQKEIESMGWKVYRISGSKINTPMISTCDYCGKRTPNEDTLAYKFLEDIAEENNMKYNKIIGKVVCKDCM